MTVPHVTGKWRKSSRSSGTDTCVELAYAGWVRDSKNPEVKVLSARLDALMAAIKAGRLDR